MTFSVNRTTDRYGVYRLEIPEVDGVDCVDGMVIESLCQASLIGSSASDCNVPALRVSTNEISVKSKQDNLCIYSLKAMSYRPSKKNRTLCGNQKEEMMTSPLNSSKFFLPYFSPYGFPWPQLPPLPPLPQLPPFPKFPFPPLPPLPSFPFPHFPFPNPPSLPFPFPPLPPFPPTPFVYPPPPPAFNLGDPRTWVPNFPPLYPPPSPPAFNLGDPRTWNPYPPSLPHMPQMQSP
ncbi:putative Pollen Ole e 1 allergen and extensin family protein [Tripterygium wilfordii]|uniref:Putative Pollen Ole e 1 allergen and extensin family protein n=2 Tax=Tripterygium wilfordii TaxID=458696 RepID=A0A7J7D4C5_TRIWF|nr:putative Pollen Ole e 1 allergen and extensin family protein [Tripterygium wilfordii]